MVLFVSVSRCAVLVDVALASNPSILRTGVCSFRSFLRPFFGLRAPLHPAYVVLLQGHPRLLDPVSLWISAFKHTSASSRAFHAFRDCPQRFHSLWGRSVNSAFLVRSCQRYSQAR